MRWPPRVVSLNTIFIYTYIQTTKKKLGSLSCHTHHSFYCFVVTRLWDEVTSTPKTQPRHATIQNKLFVVLFARRYSIKGPFCWIKWRNKPSSYLTPVTLVGLCPSPKALATFAFAYLGEWTGSVLVFRIMRLTCQDLLHKRLRGWEAAQWVPSKSRHDKSFQDSTLWRKFITWDNDRGERVTVPRRGMHLSFLLDKKSLEGRLKRRFRTVCDQFMCFAVS